MKKEMVSQYQLKGFWRRYSYYFLPAIAVVAVVGLFILMMPQFIKFFEVRGKIKEKEEEARSLEEKLEGLKKINAALLKEDVDKATKLLPNEKKVAEVFLNLRILSEEEELFLDELMVNPGLIATESAGVEEVIFETTVYGALENIRKFLGRMDFIGPILSFEDLALEYFEEEEMWGARLSFLDFYSFKKYPYRTISPLPEISESLGEVKNKMKEFKSPYLEVVSGAVPSELPPLPVGRGDIFSLP